MPRRETPFMMDQYYHFYNRGNNRQTVFFERDNYLYFLKGVKKYICAHVDILAYCLMPTHYHILGRIKPASHQTSDPSETPSQTSDPNQTSEFLKNSEVSGRVSLAMQKFGISYTKAINKRFNRSGSLFQGQFQAKPIRNYKHLLNLCIYIHANPVKDNLVALPEDWEYSNYREWMNLREGFLVNREFITDNFGKSSEYKDLVMEFIKTRCLPEDLHKYLRELEK